ncbi:hypothetical protein [Pararhodobacter sp. CCB-MM2]|uniref:hypothetical protein n=1 Tax=Pararhodobacter sp. CCB-MM2 TaxID=1786003 RepID=UPI000836966C|nr:hypothetical protein [Pararhodobacter sp. CCB-MM2]
MPGDRSSIRYLAAMFAAQQAIPHLALHLLPSQPIIDTAKPSHAKRAKVKAARKQNRSRK